MTLKGFQFTFFKQERKVIPKDDINAYDTDTVNAVSDDGSFDDNDDEYGRLDKHPGEERRKHTQRVASCTLVSFILLLFVLLMSLNHRKSKSSLQAKNPNTKVYCSGKLTFTLDEWLKEDLGDSAHLCDPDVSISSTEQTTWLFMNL
jgi:hypothetical protein